MNDTAFSWMVKDHPPNAHHSAVAPAATLSSFCHPRTSPPRSSADSSSRHPSQDQVLSLLQNKNSFNWKHPLDQPGTPGYPGVGMVTVSLKEHLPPPHPLRSSLGIPAVTKAMALQGTAGINPSATRGSGWPPGERPQTFPGDGDKALTPSSWSCKPRHL